MNLNEAKDILTENGYELSKIKASDVLTDSFENTMDRLDSWTGKEIADAVEQDETFGDTVFYTKSTSKRILKKVAINVFDKLEKGL